MSKTPCKVPDSILPELKSLQSVLEKDEDIELVILFGSLSKGSFSPESDIDIAIKKHKPITQKQKIQLIEQITLMTGRAVDLVDLSIVGEPLLGQILKYGKRLLGSDSCYAKLGIKHVNAQADFMPYVDRALKERRQIWLADDR